MTMVERVARAIHPSVWEDDNPSWAHLEGPLRADFIALKRRRSLQRARAAIEAMREPTTAMHDRAAAVINRDGSMDKAWKAAIAAALAEG
jgi:hypothetical protein